MARNDLAKAKDAKKDEFYTQLADIEKELRHYTEHFRGKVVFCNCDDPYESNFFKYFAMNFNHLGLKRLIATCYNGSPVQGNELLLQFDTDNPEEPKKIAYKIEISEVHDANGDGAIDLADVRYLLQNDKNAISILKGNGDFRSEECIELLKEADIVVTNPPFSLFREYLSQLDEYGKHFIIIGNVNAISYKESFRLIKEDKMWLGASIHSGDREFQVPEGYPLNAAGCRVDEHGRKFIRVKGVRWFTNLDYKERHEDLILYKSYNPEEYPKYDNYDAINIDKTADIPCDYDGAMGVPITFLDKYNPEQFEIEALGIVGSCNFTCMKKMEILDKEGKSTGKFTINAKGTLYRKFNPKVDKVPAFKDVQTGELYQSIYARVIIRKKQ
ncbi:MAG: adenine-specific methyltransferase EcoRI family protein [Paludibacteraceae bacterium]|nr:adenine-specific methyltransferase EcoRI family protein [Paludibacteraceae bacterium]